MHPRPMRRAMMVARPRGSLYLHEEAWQLRRSMSGVKRYFSASARTNRTRMGRR